MPSSKPIYLSRYFDVVKDNLPSQFMIAKTVGVNFNADQSLEELTILHEITMKTFRERFSSIGSLDDIPEPAGSSLLDLKIAIAEKILEKCIFCERRCRINRKKKMIGFCRLDAVSRYSSEFLHMGEEPELVPSNTTFFTGCNFLCLYCQNWQISTAPQSGTPILPQELAKIITVRRMYGSRNVNFVTPTPHTHTILKVLKGVNVNVPVVWNSNMYYSEEVARLLEGIVDVYLGDLRYGNDKCAVKFSKVPNYWPIVTRNFTSAYNNAEILLRHLVLPGHIECCTRPIIRWTKENIPKIRFNLMFQYHPHYRAREFPEINRTLSPEECEKALGILRESGLEDVLV
jgi:putative pyruvate formate lyase activating enzyme